MRGTCAPKPQAAEQTDDGSPSAGSRRTPPSIFGLLIVSGLNVISLGFIAYHFAGHPDEPAEPSLGRPAASNVAGVTALPQMPIDAEAKQEPLGNIELAPAPKRILGIASHIEALERASDCQRKACASVMLAAASRLTKTANDNPGKAPEHWLQLGALSNETTAMQYWSRLETRHAALLQGREPRYFGPGDVGGSLYHIRLGPMTGDAAAALCRELEASGADCFRIMPRD